MVAIEMMNQEVLEESEPLLQLLALYSCHMYMTKNQPGQVNTLNIEKLFSVQNIIFNQFSPVFYTCIIIYYVALGLCIC